MKAQSSRKSNRSRRKKTSETIRERIDHPDVQAFARGVADGARKEERAAIHERLERFHHQVANAHALAIASECMAGAAREPGAIRRAHTLMGLLLGELDALVGAIGELDASVRS